MRAHRAAAPTLVLDDLAAASHCVQSPWANPDRVVARARDGWHGFSQLMQFKYPARDFQSDN
jgi:hypothetical protein